MHVRAGDGQVDLHARVSAGRGLLVMNKDDVRREDLAGDVFQAHDFLRDAGVDSAGEADVAGAEMDLHGMVGWGGLALSPLPSLAWRAAALRWMSIWELSRET